MNLPSIGVVLRDSGEVNLYNPKFQTNCPIRCLLLVQSAVRLGLPFCGKENVASADNLFILMGFVPQAVIIGHKIAVHRSGRPLNIHCNRMILKVRRVLKLTNQIKYYKDVSIAF